MSLCDQISQLSMNEHESKAFSAAIDEFEELKRLGWTRDRGYCMLTISNVCVGSNVEM